MAHRALVGHATGPTPIDFEAHSELKKKKKHHHHHHQQQQQQQQQTTTKTQMKRDFLTESRCQTIVNPSSWPATTSKFRN